MRHADDVLQASTRARAWPARRAGCAVGAADRWEAAPSVQRPGSRYRPQDAGDASRLAWDCQWRSEEHTSELQSLMRISYAVFCLEKKTLQHMLTKSYHTREHNH